jgi:hypothetical protein
MSWIAITFMIVIATLAAAFVVSEWLARRRLRGPDDESAMG